GMSFANWLGSASANSILTTLVTPTPGGAFSASSGSLNRPNRGSPSCTARVASLDGEQPLRVAQVAKITARPRTDFLQLGITVQVVVNGRSRDLQMRRDQGYVPICFFQRLFQLVAGEQLCPSAGKLISFLSRVCCCSSCGPLAHWGREGRPWQG